MKVIGFVIILIALFFIGWWVLTDHQHKQWALTLCIMAIFTGIFMILQDRAIEISLKGIGTIKAAAQQAATDAEAIANLKKRVETQSATVDLVAKSANDASELVNKLQEKSEITDNKLTQLDDATQDALNALQGMERATDFATTLLAAQNDNWIAFDQLRKWADDKTFPLSEIAGNAYVKIRVSYGSVIEPGYLNINWSPGIDPSKLSQVEFTKSYLKLSPIYHAHLVHVVCGRTDIPKKERMTFLVHVLKSSNSLTAKEYAAKFFVQAAGDINLKWQPFNLVVLLNWWEKHKDEIK